MASLALLVPSLIAWAFWSMGDPVPVLPNPATPVQDAVNVTNPVTVVGPDDTFSFKAPRGLLGTMLVSRGAYPEMTVVEWPVRGSRASIRMVLLRTSGDDEETGGIYSPADFDRQFIRGRTPTFRTKTKAGRRVASGYLNDGRIFYRQGDYTEMVSMRGQQSGAPQWLWSQSWIIEFVYPEEQRAAFDKIIPLVTRSLTVNAL